MKKIICILLSLAILLSLLAMPSAFADELLISPAPIKDIYTESDGKYTFDGDEILSIWKEFEANFPERTDATDAEKAAAEYLVSELEELGYTAKNGSFFQNFSVYTENSETGGYLMYSQNVVGVKKSSRNTDKTVIIGAHYDNAYGLSNSLSKGAYDNGSGVATLIAIARAVIKSDLPFNVEIVFFGMEELGVNGSEAYVSKMTEEEIDNTLMMINVDSVSCGDYLYLFSDEIARSHEDMFFESALSAENGGITLNKMPKDKKSNGYFRVSDKKPFVHVGLQSDNAPFMEKGIPSAFFFGYNISSKENINGQESDGKVDIMHTENDNVDVVLSVYGEDFVKNRFAFVAGTVMTTLSREDFIENAEYSKAHPTVYNFVYETWFFFVVVAIVFVAFALAVYFVSKKDWGKLPTIGIIIKAREESEPAFENDDADVFE